MPRYLVSASSFISGTYKAETPDAAVRLYIQDAGYQSVEAAAEASGQSVERFRRDLIVIDDKFMSEPDPRDGYDYDPQED